MIRKQKFFVIKLIDDVDLFCNKVKYKNGEVKIAYYSDTFEAYIIANSGLEIIPKINVEITHKIKFEEV